MIKVSILIPLYNSEKHISETIESCLNQTYKNIEIIIIDDGSTDNSFNLAKTYESENVIVVKQKNSGACVARNKAFELSTGTYIQYLDADDLLDENKISEQMNFIKDNTPNVLFSGKWDRFYNNIDECVFPNMNNYKSFDNPTDWFIETWKNNEMAQTSVWLTHRNLIETSRGWNETLKVNQDGEFFSRIILLSEKIIFSSKSKIYYRSGLQNSISNQGKDKATSLYMSYRLYEKNILAKRSDNEIKYLLAVNYANFIYRFNPMYPELITKCWKNIEELGIKKIIPNTGSKFKFIMKLIGFKKTLKLKAFFKV